MEFREITLSDSKRLDDLHIELYGFGLGEDYFKQKLKTGLFGLGSFGFAALDNEFNIQGVYLAYLSEITCTDGTKLLAAQSGDSMVSKKAQGRGLFLTLAKHCYSLLSEMKVDVIYGFPNNASIKLFERLGWKSIYRVKQNIFPLLPIRVSQGKVNFFFNELVFSSNKNIINSYLNSKVKKRSLFSPETRVVALPDGSTIVFKKNGKFLDIGYVDCKSVFSLTRIYLALSFIYGGKLIRWLDPEPTFVCVKFPSFFSKTGPWFGLMPLTSVNFMLDNFPKNFSFIDIHNF